MENNAGVLVWAALAVLIELSQYLSIASPRMRELWTRPWLVAMAPVSFLVYTVPMGTFQLRSLIILVALAAAAAYWFAVFPKHRWSQILFVAFVAAVTLFKVFPLLYPRAADIRLDILGQLLWIRIALITLLRDVQPEGIQFGFWPTWREWKIGATCFAALLPLVFLLSAVVGFAQFAWPAWSWWETALRGAGTFFGILWVTALSEEFLFRGMLQRWVGLPAASILFGLVHLGFRQFPNWRFAIVAAVAGVFYGIAYRRGQGIRAAMVAHALTVVAWKTLFR